MSPFLYYSAFCTIFFMQKEDIKPLLKLETISLNQAELLVKNSPLGLNLDNLTSMSNDVAKVLGTYDGLLLSFKGLKTLDPVAAEELGKANVFFLNLSGLTELNSGLATAFTKASALRFIQLDGVREIDSETAEILAQVEASISLGGLSVVTPRVAASLAKRNSLNLGGISSLNLELANIFSEHQGEELSFPNLLTMTSRVAEALSAHKGQKLTIGVKEINEENGKIMSRYRGNSLILKNVQGLQPKEAEALSNYKGVLSLPGLSQLSRETAAALSNQTVGGLELNGLKSIEESACEELSKHKGGNLTLNNVDNLSERCAFLLSRHNFFQLHLNGLETISLETAKAISKQRGELSLNGLKEISPEIASVLGEHTLKLNLGGIEVLSQEAARALGEKKTKGFLSLGIKKIDAKLAYSLTWQKLSLSFTRLEDIPPDVAGILSKTDAGLEFHNLKDISIDSAEMLAKHQGVGLTLGGLSQIPDPVLNKLTKYEGYILSLPSVQDLSDNGYSLISECKFFVNLSGINEISKENLKKLKQNKKIFIPQFSNSP